MEENENCSAHRHSRIKRDFLWLRGRSNLSIEEPSWVLRIMWSLRSQRLSEVGIPAWEISVETGSRLDKLLQKASKGSVLPLGLPANKSAQAPVWDKRLPTTGSGVNTGKLLGWLMSHTIGSLGRRHKAGGLGHWENNKEHNERICLSLSECNFPGCARPRRFLGRRTRSAFHEPEF